MVREISIRVVVMAVVISTFLSTVISVGHAQAVSFKSPVTVRVFDGKGAAIANCVVVIRNDSGVIASHTEADGALTLSLQSGRYSVTASKAGFVRTNLEVQVPISEALRVIMNVDTIGDHEMFEIPNTDTGSMRYPPLDLTVLNNADFQVRRWTPKKRSWRCLYVWKCSTS